MVAHRSPKPFVRVRVLLPLPKKKTSFDRDLSFLVIFAKTAEGNNTCRKTNITAKQYHSPQANKTAQVSLRTLGQRLGVLFFIPKAYINFKLNPILLNLPQKSKIC